MKFRTPDNLQLFLYKFVLVILILGAIVALAPTTIKAETLDEKKILVLDPGHGGEDPGAIDPGGTIYEADVVQQISTQLLQLLKQHQTDLEVIVTKPQGVTMGIMDRAAVAAQNRADLFLSLHLNASAHNPAAKGFMVFPALPGKPTHQQSMVAAQKISAQLQNAGIAPFAGNGIFYAVYQNESDKLFIDSTTVDSSQPIEGNTYGVVEYAETPALLLEQWFITNSEDMALHNTPQGREAMAHAIYLGLCDYLGLTPLQ